MKPLILHGGGRGSKSSAGKGHQVNIYPPLPGKGRQESSHSPTCSDIKQRIPRVERQEELTTLDERKEKGG